MTAQLPSLIAAQPPGMSSKARCAWHKLGPHILVMQSAQDGVAENAANRLDRAWDNHESADCCHGGIPFLQKGLEVFTDDVPNRDRALRLVAGEHQQSVSFCRACLSPKAAIRFGSLVYVPSELAVRSVGAARIGREHGRVIGFRSRVPASKPWGALISRQMRECGYDRKCLMIANRDQPHNVAWFFGSQPADQIIGVSNGLAIQCHN
jgi:hypothetical protein